MEYMAATRSGEEVKKIVTLQNGHAIVIVHTCNVVKEHVRKLHVVKVHVVKVHVVKVHVV